MSLAPPPAIVAAAAFAPLPADLVTILRKRAGKTEGAVLIIARRRDDDVEISWFTTTTSRKADQHTRFEVDGLTEAVTGTLLADSVRRGEVRLDEPIDELRLPGLSVPPRGAHRVTLVDLATHRAGLPLVPLREAAQPYAAFDGPALLAAVNATAAPNALAFAPTPLDFGLLGALLAERAGVTFADLAAQRIFVPLAMADTTVDPDHDDQLIDGRSIDGRHVAPWRYAALAPAGGMRSSARDLLGFAGSLFDDDNGPLAADGRQAMIPRADARGGGIGLGWLTDRASGGVYVSGASYGATAFLGVDPRRHTAVVLLSNVGLTFADATLDDVGLRILGLTAQAPSR